MLYVIVSMYSHHYTLLYLILTLGQHHHKVDGSRKLALMGVEGRLLLPSRQKTARWEHDPASQPTQPHTTAPIDFEKLQFLEKCLGF